MESRKINKEIVAIFMESPLYFSIPLERRLIFIKFFSQKPVFNTMHNPKKPEKGCNITRKD
jgi:hypothetical protein